MKRQERRGAYADGDLSDSSWTEDERPESAEQPVAQRQVRCPLASTAQDDQLLLEQEILRDHRSHATGATQLRGHDGPSILDSAREWEFETHGVAERFVRTARSECLDWLLIVSQQHLERSLKVFVNHYNCHRPHRALSLAPPEPKRAPVTPARGAARVECRDHLGGVIHEYVLAA
jgi:hypothetical protein